MCELGPSEEKKAALALAEIIRAKPGGLKIGDKKAFFFKTYIKTFSGKEIVTWLVGHGHAKNREEAVFKLQSLIDQHIFHHVTDTQRFKDSDSLYYRFFEDETAAVLKSEKETATKVSVTELLSGCHGVTQHGNVDVKAFFGWNTRYLALRADEGILYIFENEIAPAPKEEVYVGDTSLLKEVLDLRKGWYSWTLTTATNTYTFSNEKI